MPIVAADLKFLSSERMTDVQTLPDASAGGGYAAGPVIQDGVSNNVFPDVMPTDRITGKRQLRLVYPAVLSSENSAASNAGLAVYLPPTDPAVEWCLFPDAALPAGGPRSARWAATQLDQFQMSFLPSAAGASATATVTTTGAGDLQSYVGIGGLILGTNLNVGDVVLAYRFETGAAPLLPAPGFESTTLVWRTVSAVNFGAATLQLSGVTPWTAGQTVHLRKYDAPPFRISAAALTTVALSATDQNVTVDRTLVRVQPTGASAGTPGLLAAPSILNGSGDGRVPFFFVGGKVLLQHISTPATREVRTIESVNYLTGVVRLTAGLTNAYPVGSTITALADMGSLQATVGLAPFMQQAWTRTWADVASGPAIVARYTGAVGMNNAGGTTDRWAVVFTSATAFNLISERLGQIASGNTASNFLPLNPLTSQPYFTLFATGWGGGWLPGNVVRFNTVGAHAGAWVSRCTSPSVASGANTASLVIRADVDA